MNIRLKSIILLALHLLLAGCIATAQSAAFAELVKTNTGAKNETNSETESNFEQYHSLKGEWKFHTIFGDGSNYRNIQPENSDIIIDNSDLEQVIITGDWERDSTESRGTYSWGSDYLKHNYGPGESSAGIRFMTEVSESGYYEHFVFYPFALHQTVNLNVKHAAGSTTKYVNQRNRCNQWISLGIHKLEEGVPSYLEVTASSPGLVSADAVMLRPVSKEKMDLRAKEKASVHSLDYDDTSWHTMQVPGHWGMINEFSSYSGKGWYRKTLDLPASWEKKSDERILLKFEAVYHLARIYINGREVGTHRGGFTPFELDVTEHVNFQGPNVIAVEADNNYMVGATWNWGGITRDVHFVKTKDVRILNQYVHADPDLKTGTASLDIAVEIENTSAVARDIIVLSSIMDGTFEENIDLKINIPPHSMKTFQLQTEIPAEKVKLWHFDHPHLYNVETTLRDSGRSLSQSKEQFGIRKIEVTATQMLLNGEPVRLAGYNRVNDHRYWGSSDPEGLIHEDVDLMKNAGANFMRIMHGTQDKKLIERCDEKGILLFEEINVRDLGNPEFQSPDYPLVKQWLREMIVRDRNHPSIIGWSVGNELTEHYDFAQRMIEYVKTELDSHRLVSCVSNSGYQSGDSPATDPLGFSDLLLQNIYQQDAGKVMDTLRERWNEKAMFVSEFPIRRFPDESLDNGLDGADWYSQIREKRPYVVGASLWTFNDYRSSYIQTLENDNRTWGIVNVWRQKRRLYAEMQKENSPVHNVEIASFLLEDRKANVTIPIKSMNDFPSYTMTGYYMAWEFQDIDGAVLQRGTEQLPVLRPGDDEWRGSFSWDAKVTSAYKLSVRLLSPNGYVRYEREHFFAVPKTPEIKEVLKGHDAIRVLINKTADAQEYYVEITTKDGITELSKRTVDPYIDLKNLEKSKEYTLSLVASNTKGSSPPSLPVTVITGGKLLPPVIWKAYKVGSDLVVGYSGEKGDMTYSVRYGSAARNLDKEITTTERGTLVVKLEGNEATFFKMKRVTKDGESDWSETIKIEK